MLPTPIRRIALLFAVRQELAPLVRRLRPSRASTPDLRHYPVFFGELSGVETLVVAGGVGRRRAAEAAEELLGVWKPDLLVMTGVAGALDPSLEVGQVVVADAVFTEGPALLPDVMPGSRRAAEDRSVRGSQPARNDNSAFARGEGSRGMRPGALLSLDRVLVTALEKRAALDEARRAPGDGSSTSGSEFIPTPNAQHPTPLLPLAVEMETAGVARVCAARGIAWAAVRGISDHADESLPMDFNRLREPDGDLSTARVALAALTQPASIPALLRLGRNTTLAAEALAGFLVDWLEEPH